MKPNICKHNGLDLKPIISSYNKPQQKPKKIKWSAFKAQHIVLPVSAVAIRLVDNQGTQPNHRLSQLQPARMGSASAKANNMCLSQSLNCRAVAAATDSIKLRAAKIVDGLFNKPIAKCLT